LQWWWLLAPFLFNHGNRPHKEFLLSKRNHRPPPSKAKPEPKSALIPISLCSLPRPKISTAISFLIFKKKSSAFSMTTLSNPDVFTAEAFPLSLVVLIDDDLKSQDAAQMAPTLRAITGGISSSDEAIICRFDLSFYPGDGFSADLNKLWADLKDAQDHSGPSTSGAVPFVTPPSSHPLGVGEPPLAAPTNLGSRPTKALDDAVHSAAELLHDRGASRRKIILLISDGLNGPQFNHHTYPGTLEALLHDNISVYSLAVGHSFKRKFSRLVNYANDSGGDIYYAVQSATMERLYSRITEEARHEYTLAYVPRGNNRNASYHKVEIRATREGLTIKTRKGYFTGPLAVPAKQ